MSTDGISLSIVENATLDKLTKGDLRKAWEDLKEGGIQRQGKIKWKYTQIPESQVREYKAETGGLAGFHGKYMH